MQKKSKIMRILSIFLIICVVFTLIPYSALAAISTLKNNTLEKNQEILEILRGITGDDAKAQELLELFTNLGLLDENGEFRTVLVDVDGRLMTLDEIRELVNSDGVDLDKMVSVDGTSLTLRHLKTMIEIEDELQRIYNTYFNNDITLTDEHIKALESISAQLEGEGIPLVSSFSSKSIQVPSGIDHHVRAVIDTSTLNCANGAGSQNVTITLVDENGDNLSKVPDYDISIPYRFVDGSAKKSVNYEDTSGFNGTIKFTAGSTQTQKSLTFNIKNDQSRFSGQKAFLIQFDEPSNNVVLKIVKDSVVKDNMLSAEKVVLVSKDYTWPSIDVTYPDDGTSSLSFKSNKKGTYSTTARWYYVPDDVLAFMMEEGIFNTIDVELKMSNAANYVPNASLYVTIGNDGDTYFNPSNYLTYDYDVVSCYLGALEAGKTYKATTPEDFEFRPAKMKKAFTISNGGNLYVETTEYIWASAGTFTIRFYDKKAPTVKSMTVPARQYTYGQSVPILVEFDEPVNLTGVTLNANGITLSPLENTSTGTRQATFLYTIGSQEVFDDLTVSNLKGAVDLSGIAQTVEGPSTVYEDVIMPLSKFYSFSTEATSSTSVNDSGNTVVTAFLPISDNDLTRWIDHDGVYDETTGEKMMTSVYASIDGGSSRIPLYGVEGSDGSLTGLMCTFIAEYNLSDSNQSRVVEFYYTDNGTTFNNMVGKFATYIVPPVVFLEADDIELSDNFPEDGVVFLQEGTSSFKLDYSLKKAATWSKHEDFEWASSNPSVATIDRNGVIVLTGQPTGETPVSFTLTAKNGGLEGRAVTLVSRPLTVKVGLTPFLSIPEGTNHIIVRSGESAEVRWTSNLIAKNAESGKRTEFTIEVFMADYIEGVLHKGASVHTKTLSASEDAPVSSYIIPANVLEGISLIGRYSYIVEVRAAHPLKPGEIFEARAYISINSQPAIVKLGRLDNYFITDKTTSLNINWVLEHFDTLNGSEFVLEITNNTDGRVIQKQTHTQDSGDNCVLTIPKVENGYRDIYTIAAKAKNTLDDTWSYDSFVLYVYSDDALKIWIDGQEAGSTHTMSNIERISKMSSDEILALNRDIYLKNVLSINYGDYPWGQLKDQIRWSSSDSSVSSINFKNVSFYYNIEDLSYTSYRPTDTFILSGLKDGMVRITATHAETNQTKTLDVQVETLKDKLYIFQVSPKTRTTLTYINGNGIKRTVETNDNGELALFEESGIKSEIHMKSSYGDKEYVGTLYNIVSSEKDYTKLELYPVNYLRLQEISTAELYFIQSFNSTYSGQVIIRGGVYKNGEYCAQAELNDLPGTQDQLITLDSKGRFVVKMDPTQFWVRSSTEVLQADDKLEFIFEIRFPGDNYYPQLLSIRYGGGYEDAIRLGTKVVPVRPVTESEKYKPFIVSQYVDYGFKSGTRMNVLSFPGKVGPGQTSEKAELVTTVFWWGEDINSDNDKHSLTIKDVYGIVPKGQTSYPLIYPFSSIKATRNNFVLNRDTLEGWLEAGESRPLKLIMTDAKGELYKIEDLPFSVIDMLGIDRAEESKEFKGWVDKLSDNFKISPTKINIVDNVIQNGLDFLWMIAFDGQVPSGIFGVTVSPTADPTVYKVLVHLDLGNMANDNSTGIYMEDDIFVDLDATPSLMDVIDMSKGQYLEKSRKTWEKNTKQVRSSSDSISYTIGGYMEGELRYNEDKEKWGLSILGGGFNAGGGYSYSWNFNTFAGPVPVTAQFTLGGSAEIIFKSYVLKDERVDDHYPPSVDTDTINHYLTTLRIYAYIRAFAGLGFDYSVVAAKIGLFGQISFDAQFAFLNRPEIKSKADTGQKLSMKGKVGIEVVLKFLFVTHEHVLVSESYNLMEKTYNQWNDIHKLWENIRKVGEQITDKAEYMLSAPMDMGASASTASKAATIERRDYLEQFERTWNEPLSMSRMLMAWGVSEDEVRHLETNSYPYSNPVLTKDGQIMLYVSDADSTDVEKTEVRWTKLTAGGYPNGSAIEAVPGGFGDSQVKLAGDQDFAAAAWVRLSKSINKEAGDPVTSADIALMSNSTEIMAALYNGSSWDVYRLTENATPDLAPAVATNGNKVIVAWRSVYAADSSNPLDFSGYDTIKYRIYDKSTGQWSETQTLYNGSSGSVRGLEAAMLKDGTSAVVYTIDANDIVVTHPGMSSLETVYAVVDADGQVIKNVRQTNDIYLDENPQITTVSFADGKERFVLGWYSEHDVDGVKVNDIRLCAFDNMGVLYDGFIDSIHSVNANASVNISRNFQFVNNAVTIDQLSILWAETENAHINEDKEAVPDRDLLKAVKFRNDRGFIYITAPLLVAQMDDYTLINHFSVYSAGENTVKAVLLGTNYNNGYKEIVVDSGSGTETVTVPIAISHLYTAVGTFKNDVGVDYAAVDYTSVIRGLRIPVQFSVYNNGVDIIERISLKVGDNTAVYDEGFMLLPNESRLLTAYYDIPEDKLVNPAYTVTASFAGGDIDIVTDILYLDIPDIGISNFETISSENGKRDIQVTLYNSSDSMLYGSGRRVRIGFYSDEECTQLVSQVSGQEGGQPYTVPMEDLVLIDEGAYTRQFTFDIAAFVGEDKEIPTEGIRLYARAWVEEQEDPSNPDSEMDKILEYNRADNVRSILFESLLALYQAPVTIMTEQTNETDSTQARVTVKNNSLCNRTTGNLIVSLLDESGRVLDSQQCYDTQAANNGLIALGGEQSAQRVFSFNQKGAAVEVSYSDAVLAQNNNANLATLTLTGIPFQLENGKTEYALSVKDMTSTLITATTEDPEATVTINGRKTNLGNLQVNLGRGQNVINIVVTAADGVTVKNYKITVNNVKSGTPNDNNTGGSGSDGSNSQAYTEISNEAIKKLIDEVGRGNRVWLNARGTGDETRFVFTLPADGMAYLAVLSGSLGLSTPLFDVVLDAGAVADLAGSSNAQIRIVIEMVDGNPSVTILVDGQRVEIINGYLIVFMDMEDTGSGTVAVIHHEDGSTSLVKLSWAGGGRMVIPLKGSCVFSIMDNTQSFNDIQNHWAKGYIQFVAARSLFQGTGANRFSPALGMTRGMIVTVLGRLCDVIAEQYTGQSFKDVDLDAFYARYVEWAARNGIVRGNGQGSFFADAYVTREQLAVILYNFLQYLGLELNEQNSGEHSFADAGDISGFAKEAVMAMYRAGVINGKNGNVFDPQGIASRAEVAAMLERLIRAIKW